MPKDPKKNVDRYKIRGGDINEFEYDKNQEAFAAQGTSDNANLIPGMPPEKKAAKKTAGRKAWPRKISFSTRGASPKKLAAKKAAKKKAATKKAATKKSAGKKAAKKK